MGVTVANVISGPGDLYTGAFGATEPVDTAVASAPGAPWVDAGGTNDGVNMNVEQEFFELTVDQVVDRVGSRVSKRTYTLQANCAEPTLENLAVAINVPSANITTGGTGATAWKKLEPASDTSITQPTYSALLFDGWAPNMKRRRFIVRKCLVTDNVSFAYKKDEQTVLTVTWTAHYVSSSIKPWVAVDSTAP